MRFEQVRHGFKITPETTQDEAFIEDTLGLRIEGNFVPLTRMDYMDGHIMHLIVRHVIPTIKEVPG